MNHGLGRSSSRPAVRGQGTISSAYSFYYFKSKLPFSVDEIDTKSIFEIVSKGENTTVCELSLYKEKITICETAIWETVMWNRYLRCEMKLWDLYKRRHERAGRINTFNTLQIKIRMLVSFVPFFFYLLVFHSPFFYSSSMCSTNILYSKNWSFGMKTEFSFENLSEIAFRFQFVYGKNSPVISSWIIVSHRLFHDIWSSVSERFIFV